MATNAKDKHINTQTRYIKCLPKQKMMQKRSEIEKNKKAI